MISKDLEKQTDSIAREIVKLLLQLDPNSKPKPNAHRIKVTIPAINEFSDSFRVTTTLKFSPPDMGGMTYTREIMTDHEIFDLTRPPVAAQQIFTTMQNTFTESEIQNLAQNCTITATPKPAEKSEKSIQDGIRDFSSKLGMTLYRNTVGQFKTVWGGIVHTGLCKGSSDLIGWTQITITPEMVGRQAAIFTAVECKKASKGANTTSEQDDFIAKVLRAGGYAGVATRNEDLLEIAEKKL